MNKRLFYQLLSLFFVLGMLISAIGVTPVSAQSNQPPANWTPPAWVVVAAQADDAPPTFNVGGYTGVSTEFILERAEKLGMLDEEVEVEPFGSVLDTTQWEYAAQFLTGCTPDYHAIYTNRMDTLYVYPKNPVRWENGGTLKTKSDEVILFWTGNYRDTDPTHGGKIIKFCVEGDTGIYLLPPNSSEKIKTGLAYITLKGWNGETEPRKGKPMLVKGDIEAEACENSSKVTKQIQDNMGTEELFALLDDDVNLNADARFAWGWDADIHAVAGKTLVWTQTGQVGPGWAEVTRSQGKSLYVALKTGVLKVYHPFSGMKLCHAYPGYDNLKEVKSTASASAESLKPMTNAEFEKYITDNRKGKLFEMLGLLPSVVYERGTHETKWNTFIVTSAGVTDPNLMKITELNTLGGYRVLYFVTTDSVTEFSADWAVFTVKDAFSPADDFSWWGGSQ